MSEYHRVEQDVPQTPEDHVPLTATERSGHCEVHEDTDEPIEMHDFEEDEESLNGASSSSSGSRRGNPGSRTVTYTPPEPSPGSLNIPSSSYFPPPIYEKELPPPDYQDPVPPPYISPAVADPLVVSGTMDELLIDGEPVGHPFILIVNLFITLAFDFIGFMLTYLLANTHSARCGSRLGFGLTLVRYGLMARYADVDEEMLAYKHYHTNITPAEIKAQNQSMSYLLLFFGFFMMMYAYADYYRVNKIRALILAAAADPAQQA